MIYLDGLAVAPLAVFSLRKLVSGAPLCLRLRRSSDDAEMDIGFDGDAIDSDAVASFLGADVAYVAAWYDQSGNGFDACPGASQPRLQDGVVRWNGSSDFLKIDGLQLGTPYLGLYGRGWHGHSATNRVFVESSANYPTASQAFLMFCGPNKIWSINANNSAGQQRLNQYAVEDFTDLVQFSALWDRSLSGNAELRLYIEGAARTKNSNAAGVIEQTGVFDSNDVYIGARGGSSLFAAMSVESLVFYKDDTAAIRSGIENVIGHGRWYWQHRLNAPTTITKIDGTYFLVDCWHHRVIYSDDVTKPAAEWNALDSTHLRGPHSIASDGHLCVTEDTDGQERVYSFKRDGLGGFSPVQSLQVGPNLSRPHRIHYDAATAGFYVLNSMSQQMVKLVRSGDWLSIAHTSALPFLSGRYTRSFNIVDGKMYFAAEPGKVYEVVFDGVGGYDLAVTYELPAGFSSPNDVYRDTNGDWWITATENAIIRGPSLAAIASGAYTDEYANLWLGGTPYYLSEFDGAMWIPEIIDRNGINCDGMVVSDYGPENASSLSRHNAGP